MSGEPCRDCGAGVGTPHTDGCDVARCVLTGSQRLACETFYDHDHGQDVWSGEWPGVAECREFGWYATFVPDMGWLRCGRDDPGAVEDLNRLHMGEARWDPGQRRWVLTSTAGSRTATP